MSYLYLPPPNDPDISDLDAFILVLVIVIGAIGIWVTKQPMW